VTAADEAARMEAAAADNNVRRHAAAEPFRLERGHQRLYPGIKQGQYTLDG
jgi:hypothetical protein